MVELSVVVPVYRCADCVSVLYDRIAAAVEPLGLEWELIFVDDRSPDAAWARIRALAESSARVRGIRLSRNFGQHAAITAGLSDASGAHVVVMDCDLQDRPEDIPRLYEQASAGHDIVFARRKNRHHSWFRRLAARMYFKLLNVFVDAKLDGEYGTFSILSRRVLDEFLRFRDRRRHYLFILNWLGFEHAAIDVEHAEREAGASSYSLRRLIAHALDGVFFQTTVLLRWIVYLGFIVSFAGVGLAAYLIYFALVATPYPGWTSLAVLILLVGGFIIITAGVAGLYVGEIFDQVKERPLFIVDERTGSGSAT